MRFRISTIAVIAGGILLLGLFTIFFFQAKTDGEGIQKPVSRKYILAALRLVGNEILVDNDEIKVKASRQNGGEIVVAFTLENPSVTRKVQETPVELARVIFSGRDTRVEPESLVQSGDERKNDIIRLRVALVALSYFLKKESSEEFIFYIDSPKTIRGGESYAVVMHPAPYYQGHFQYGRVIDRSGRLKYVPSPAPSY